MALSKEQENYIKISLVTLDVMTFSLRCLLDSYITRKGLTLVRLLDINKHKLFHLYKIKPCTPSCHYQTSLKILSRQQVLKLFDTSKCGSSLKAFSSFSICPVIPTICSRDLDITMLRVILTACCGELFWNNCLKPGQTLGVFLSENKHDLYHLWWFNQRCCKCSKNYVFPSDHCVLSKSQFKTLFPLIVKTLCSHNSSCILCSSEPSPIVSVNDLEDDVISAVLDFTCKLKMIINKIVKLRNEVYAHVVEAKLSDSEFKKNWQEITGQIFSLSKYTRNMGDVVKKVSEVGAMSLSFDDHLKTIKRIQDEVAREAKLEKNLKKTNAKIEQVKKTIDDVLQVSCDFKSEIKEKLDHIDGKLDVVLQNQSNSDENKLNENDSNAVEDTSKVTLCSPCNNRHLHTQAQHVCLDCEEAFCSQCGACHISSKLSRSHRLISPCDHQKIKEFKLTANCSLHERNLDYYCPSHDDPVCIECVQKCHTNCLPPKPVSEVAKSYRQSGAFFDIERHIGELSQTLQHLTKQKKANHDLLDEDSKRITETLRSCNTELLQNIKESLSHHESDIVSRLFAQVQQCKTCLEADSSQLEKMRVKTEFMMSQWSHLKSSGTDSQIFFGTRELKDKLVTLETVLRPLMKASETRIEFKMNETINKLAFKLQPQLLGETIILSKPLVTNYITYSDMTQDNQEQSDENEN